MPSLRRAQARTARERTAIFDINDEQEQRRAFVFDVSTLAAIEHARSSSEQFREALTVLERHGLSIHAPGFDTLTLNPQRPQSLDRLIELKSSGVNARIQEMSWNEWKCREATVLVDKATGRVTFPHMRWESGETFGTEEVDSRLIETAETVVAILDAGLTWRRTTTRGQRDA